MGRRADVVRRETGATRWEIATRPLPDALRPLVLGMMGYVEESPGAVSQRQLPGPQVVLIVELGPPIRITDPLRRGDRFPGGFVAGVSDFATVTEHDGFQRGIQVDLAPVAARALFGIPMSELAGRVVPLSDLLPRDQRSLAERLHDLPDWDARFAAIEALLAAALARTSVRGEIVARACACLDASRGNLDIRALARELGYSEKQVVRLFRDQVGIAPKLYARLVRFDRLVGRLRNDRKAPWAELAGELGYYDQAHLVRDIRHFAGTTPTGVRASLDALDLPLI